MVDYQGQQLMWWIGRDNKIKNSYWGGSHHPSEHVCACKKDLSCTRDLHSCNCDAERADEWVSDVGLLANKTALPVTQLHIGGMAGSRHAVHFELGPLVCAGQQVPELIFFFVNHQGDVLSAVYVQNLPIKVICKEAQVHLEYEHNTFCYSGRRGDTILRHPLESWAHFIRILSSWWSQDRIRSTIRACEV